MSTVLKWRNQILTFPTETVAACEGSALETWRGGWRGWRCSWRSSPGAGRTPPGGSCPCPRCSAAHSGLGPGVYLTGDHCCGLWPDLQSFVTSASHHLPAGVMERIKLMTELINKVSSLIHTKIKLLIFVKKTCFNPKERQRQGAWNCKCLVVTDLVKIRLEKPQPGLVGGGEDGPGQGAGVLTPHLRGHHLVPPQPRGHPPLCQAQS